MEIRSLGWNKTEILPSCGRISIAVRLHHLDSNKTIREKTGWDVYKDAARCIKQILEATPYKTAAVWPSTSHLTNHPREKNSTSGHCWRSKDELISDVLLWTPTHGYPSVGRPAKTYIHQLCEDTDCHLEDLPHAMADRDGWRERVNGIRANSTPR